MEPIRTTHLRRHVSPSNLIAAGVMLLAGRGMLNACGGSNDGSNMPGNAKPAFTGKITINRRDGVSDDLLTTDLGASGLASVTTPTIANLTAPAAAGLRRLMIHASYRALVDTAAKGGYGILYGPNVDASGSVTQDSDITPDTEYVMYSDDGTGQQNVVLLVQIPDSFDVNNSCVITATPSGSRGIYSAASTGEWGLRRECAVAYTDKGTGASPHDLATDTVALQDGMRTTRSVTGSSAHFAALFTSSQPAVSDTAAPSWLAFEHAHSQCNPEKNWGLFTLQAAQFAFWAISDKIARASGAPVGNVLPVRPDSTIVIASSISNGGGAAIAVAEQDTGGWAGGVTVDELGLNLLPNTDVQVVHGDTILLTTGKPLPGYVSYVNVLRLCAASSTSVATAPAQIFFDSLTTLPASAQANRCAVLRAAGLLTSTTAATQTDEALRKVRTYGWEPESDLVYMSMLLYEIDPSVSTTFSSVLFRASVIDNLCGLSFAMTDISFHPAAVSVTALAQTATVDNGVPPTSGVQLVGSNTQGGPMQSNQSVDSTSTQAANLDGALYLCNLLAGADAASQSLQAGVRQTLRTGNLQGKPALIVQGRNDALLPVNHGSRSYLGLNAKVEGGSSKLSYIEVMNTQHFDGFTDLVPGYNTSFVSLMLHE